LTLPSYFSGKWGRNMSAQITMQRYGVSAMQPPPDPEVIMGHPDLGALGHVSVLEAVDMTLFAL
jgi:hypothetical protein